MQKTGCNIFCYLPKNIEKTVDSCDILLSRENTQKTVDFCNIFAIAKNIQKTVEFRELPTVSPIIQDFSLLHCNTPFYNLTSTYCILAVQ